LAECCASDRLGHPLGALSLDTVRDRGGAGLDARDELFAEFRRIVHRVEAADKERVDSQPVAFEDRLGDLFGRADET
jgi:hypothetical protein